jgi:large subunit ribosomal protein L17
MAVIELVEALTVSQQAVGEAERARGTTFAAGAGAAAASGEVTADAVETDSPQEIVADVFEGDNDRQDDGDVTPEPTAENGVVVEGDNVSPELADAAAAEINAAENSDAASAGVDAPGGEAAPDPK